MRRAACLLALAACAAAAAAAASVQCRDESGQPVDWFYVYKLPKERNHMNPLIREGLAHIYITPERLRSGWTLSGLSVGDPASMVGRTLEPLYESSQLTAVVYNDQPPNQDFPDPLERASFTYRQSQKGQKNAERSHSKKLRLQDRFYDDYELLEMCKIHHGYMKTKVEKGHTKGVLLGDKMTALWLVHSVPRFPPMPMQRNFAKQTYSYPATGTKYGQLFLCVSVQTTTLNQIGLQLKYNQPQLVYSSLPAGLETELPYLYDVINNKTIESAPWYHIENFETLAGRRFLSFAKSSFFHDDLYSGLVAEVLQSDLLVESWLNGPGPLDSECSRNFQVRNIERLKFPAAKMSFTSHDDHSKWAVAVAHKVQNSQDRKVADYWVCVGDINRALSQERRGGGTVCTSGPILWGSFAHLIDSVQNCKR